MATLEPSNMPTDSEASSSPADGTVNVGYYLRSSGHRPANFPLAPFVIGIDSSSTVLQLSTAIQKQHGDVYLQGNCRLQCPGLIIVMGLWLVDHTGLDRVRTHHLLLSEIGLGKEGPLYPLQHNPRRGIVAMEVAEPLSVYRLEVKTFSVVVEATFKIDVLPDVRVLSNNNSEVSDKSRKRQRSPPTAESSEAGKRQRLLGHPTCPVYVTGPVSDSSRIFFPKPNSNIQAWLCCPGTAFFDKTRFIPLFYGLFIRTPRIGIWLPSGTAKTATLAMLTSFFDSQCPQGTRDAFRSLEIGDRKGCGQGEYLCLKFDFQPGNIETSFRAGNYLRALNAYLSKTLKAFVKRYHQQLGLQKDDGFFLETDPIRMLREVSQQATARMKTLFVGIDNFDAGLLMSLATIESRKPAHWDEVKQTLEVFLKVLVAAPNLKLLVFGQLPVVSVGLVSLPGDHALQSAFAMTDEEMEAFFPVIAGGKEMDRTKMRGLEKKAIHGIKGPRQPSHNFALFLHYLARDFDTENDHNNPPSSPLLQSMLENQKDLFVYLRQSREAAIPPFEAEVCPNLPNLMNDKNIAWWLLHKTGGLDFSRVKKDSRWAFGPTTNGVVRDQMFKTLPRSRDLTPLERELQSLAQGKAQLLTGRMASLLYHTPIGELAAATEAVFQGMMNAYIMSGTDPANYFAQAHLILDHRKAREKEETDAPTNTNTGRGRTTDRTATTTRASRSAPATTRKAQSGSSGAKDDSSFAPESKDQPVRPKAAQGRSGYSDCLIVGLEDLALRTVVVIELKFLHLNGLLLGKEGKWHPRSPEKTQRLKALNREIRNAEMEDLMKMKYVYRDSKSKKNVETTVREYFNDGKSQAKIYAETLKCGQANPDMPSPEKRTNGILDPRVEVRPGSDCIVPMVFAAVGSRVISTHLKDMVTVHQYRGTPKWKPDI